MSVCQSVNILVYTFLHFGIHFFIGLYLFNTATDQVNFWHACTLGQANTVLMFLVTLPSLIMLIYAKSVSPSTFWYTTLFYILVYTFLSVYIFLIQQLTLGPGLYSPNVFGDGLLF